MLWTEDERKKRIGLNPGIAKVIFEIRLPFRHAPIGFILEPKDFENRQFTVKSPHLVALVSIPIAIVSIPIAIVSIPVAIVSIPVAIVSIPVAIVSTPVSILRDPFKNHHHEHSHPQVSHVFRLSNFEFFRFLRHLPHFPVVSILYFF